VAPEWLNIAGKVSFAIQHFWYLHTPNTHAHTQHTHTHTHTHTRNTHTHTTHTHTHTQHAAQHMQPSSTQYGNQNCKTQLI